MIFFFDFNKKSTGFNRQMILFAQGIVGTLVGIPFANSLLIVSKKESFRVKNL